MCVDHKISCTCGKSSASFNFKDDLLPHEVVAALYCPACSPAVAFDQSTMISDNKWLIEYDMDIARFMMQKHADGKTIDPSFLFDEGFCTWRGVYPNDEIDALKEREALLGLAKTDPKRYFQELRTWGINRMERLAAEGWRKAHETEPVNT